MVSTLRTLHPYLVRYRWQYAAGFAALLLRVLASASLPLVVGFAVDRLVAEDFNWHGLLEIGGLLVALAFARSAFHCAMHRILMGLARDIEYDFRNDLFAHLLRLSRRFYHSFRTGDLLARVTNDLGAVHQMLGAGLTYSVQFCFLFLIGLAVMSATDWRLTAFVFLPVPLLGVVTGFFGSRIHDRFQAVQAKFSDLTSAAQENLRNIRLVRAFAGQQAAMDRFGELNGSFVRESLGLARLWSRFHPLLQLLIGLTGVIVLWYGGRRVLAGEMTVGSYVMFLVYLSLLATPMSALSHIVGLWRKGTASLERINEILHQRPEIADPEPAWDAPTEIRGDLELRGVSYTYPGQKQPALKDISLSVPAGQAVAILGATGAGKTTLVSLIPRLIDPQEGQVIIDGHDARQLPLEVLRTGVGFVAQDVFLFNGSLRSNIAFGAPDAEDWEILETADTAHFGTDLGAFPAQLDTQVGEGGLTLSGGQRQRVALARAVLSNPRILVLDDACSNVDAETEADILGNLRLVMRNRTTVLISHRVSAAQLADRILVLDKGRIVESGTHDELLAVGGAYSELHRKQQLAEELELA